MMADTRLLARVKQVLAREWGIAPGGIPDDAALNGFDYWDSLGHITIMLALSAEFGFELSADTVQKLLTLPRIVEFLDPHLTTTTKATADEHPYAPRI